MSTYLQRVIAPTVAASLGPLHGGSVLQDAMLGVEDDHDIAGKEAIRQAENDLAEALKDERDLFTLVSCQMLLELET